MIRLRPIWLATLALAAVAAMPASSQAAWFGLRNETGAAIVVQTGIVVDKTVTPGRPLVIYGNEVAWDCAIKPCVKCVAIADPANPKKVLFTANVPVGPGDVFLAVKMVAPGQYRLVPAPPPAKRPR
jgi:hypothetical protein